VLKTGEREHVKAEVVRARLDFIGEIFVYVFQFIYISLYQCYNHYQE